ncbi:MAG: glutathione S-transferase family protein [Betaproteobacteria bacterium]|nr:glutathione S-transferase family protein [Betaproteobacteria bacterium]
MPLTLVIGNKNYSSWSMRPWVLLKQKGIPFTERLLKFHSAEWSEHIARLSPTRLVPVLWDGEPGAPDALAVWDTLAIAEYLADRFPGHGIWPADTRARARARSVACEMHAGFRNLRSTMPMNIRNQHPGKGLTAETARDIARVEQVWAECRSACGTGGPFLFGEFCAADAMFAPVVMRFATYHPPLGAVTQAYCRAVAQASGVAAWIADAKQETEFVAEDEPYASAPGH